MSRSSLNQYVEFGNLSGWDFPWQLLLLVPCGTKLLLLLLLAAALDVNVERGVVAPHRTDFNGYTAEKCGRTLEP